MGMMIKLELISCLKFYVPEPKIDFQINFLHNK